MEVKLFNNIEQRSIEWNALRLGRIGGSTLKDIIDANTGHLKDDYNKNGSFKSKTPVLNAIAGVISEIKTGFSNDSEYQSEAMEWGSEMEAEVVEQIENETTFKCGYVTNSSYKYFGLSPDLLSTKTGYEIKCPNSKTFALWRMKNELPKDHKVQVMDYFVMIPELEKMELVIYDPRYPDNNIFRFEVYRKDNLDFIENMSNAMKQFDKMVYNYLTNIF